MAVIRVQGFGGCNFAVHPKFLPETQGVLSYNQKLGRGDLRPLKAPSTVATVPASRSTIYRMGRDTVSDTQYWLSWTGTVHVVRGLVASDTTERTYYSGDGVPKWTDNTMALATAPYPTTARILGVPKPAAAPTAVIATAGSNANQDTRYYVYTYVTDKGEESEPSNPSGMLTCNLDATVTISGFSTPPAGNYGITLVRVYRTATGASSTDFMFLREFAVGTASTTDDNRALGEVLPSLDWNTPPTALKWMTGLWNGMLAGINDKEIRFSEPFVPYAWPAKYGQTLPDCTPVALGTFGQTLVVLTTNKPHLFMGGDPASMDNQPTQFDQACVAPLSVVSFGHGVVWAAPDGLAYLGQGGAKILTAGLMTRDDWQAIKPATIVGGAYEGAYIGFYNDGSGVKGFLIDPTNPQGLFLLDFGATVTYQDSVNDQLYLLSGTSVQKWDAGTALTATFKSKVFQMPKPVRAFACAQVVADAYPVTFKFYADGALKHTQTVTSVDAFRLPSGYYARDFQVEVATSNPVQSVSIAHSMRELSQV